MTVSNLIYKHFVYQEDILESNTDLESIKGAYDRWSQWCVITAITDKYMRVELPDKTRKNVKPVSYYADYNILDGYWVACSDYGSDTDVYYWCHNRIQKHFRTWLCRFRCKGPYLIHIIGAK